MKPFGKYVMNDVDRHGGIPVIMKAMLDEGLLHGDALTVTGKTLAENLRELDPDPIDGDGHPHASTTRSTRPAASRSCTARSLPRARS